MKIEQIKEKLKTTEYDFLRTDKNLGSNIILLGLGGSHAYGTEKPDGSSDLDCRGIALNSKKEILLGNDFEQVVDDDTDTTVYSFQKIVKLLCNVNPNCIELLGLKPEHYLYITPIGHELLNNKKLFLSKKAIFTFSGYSTQMLYKANQKSTHAMKQAELEEHILKTLQHMQVGFVGKYTDIPTDGIRLYIDKAVQEGYETEIFMDVNLTGYPLRDYCSMWNELQNTVKQYNKIGKRNSHALEHDKMGKHLMHLIRLNYMCLDILERQEINTYREKEHDLLMEIRNGKYITEDNQIRSEFFDLVNELEKQLDYAKENTTLPDLPDYDAINEFVMSVNERVVKGEV
jgi:predicted nucleotidyltransferase